MLSWSSSFISYFLSWKLSQICHKIWYWHHKSVCFNCNSELSNVMKHKFNELFKYPLLRKRKTLKRIKICDLQIYLDWSKKKKESYTHPCYWKYSLVHSYFIYKKYIKSEFEYRLINSHKTIFDAAIFKRNIVSPLMLTVSHIKNKK